jgi:pyruvate/2-oxoglutarate dehydrogenase complex dihydrolipoamide dehydrogenase (E3) component
MQRYDVFVIGGGGTGSEVAFQLGRRSDLRVAIAERDKLGGECNHYGCVPTKVMLRSAKLAAQARDAERFGVRIGGAVEIDLQAVRQRAEQVVGSQSGEGAKPFERIGIRVLLEEARLVGDHRIETASGERIEADRIVLATGTEEAIWKPERVPGSLAVIGAGAIGIEFAQIYGRFGSTVTVLEALPRILPNEDEETVTTLAPALEAEGIRSRVGVSIERARHDGRRWTLELADGERLGVDEVLVATGRRPVFDVHDLHEAGVELDERGRPVLGNTLRTTNPTIWAAGDATGDLLFTHVGSYEAELVVDDILERPRPRDYRVVPRVTYCDPEVASVGLTEQEAHEAGLEVKTAVLRIEDNERAQIDGQTAGSVKLVADGRTGEVIGGHIVGEGAGAMIHEVVAVMAARTPPAIPGEAIHAYPTLSESVKGAFRKLAEA